VSQTAGTSFGPVLRNSRFRALWSAQLLAQSAQHAIHFIQLVLIEQLTGSTIHIGLTILAFSLPGVIFSPVAGVLVDRLPKKWVLVGSNLLRVVLALCYIPVLNLLSGDWQLLGVYTLTFLTATLAQFFAPAEAATIPLLVGEDHLLAANSLFTLTMVIAQVIGLLMLGPLSVGLLQVRGGFILIALLYLLAALSVSRLPRDVPAAHGRPSIDWSGLWDEFRVGLRFVAGQPPLQAAMTQLVTIATLVMIMAMLAPGYAARVLGMSAQNAILVIAPAGLGMLLAGGVVGRWGHVLRRARLAPLGLALAGLCFAALGLVSLDYHRLLQPILAVYPRAAFSLASATMAIGLALGFFMATVNIVSQTTLQLESPPHVRGRVFSVQFMLNNLLGIPPMLALAGIADAVGIPSVLFVVGAGTVVMAVISLVVGRRRLQRPESTATRDQSDVAAALREPMEVRK
jgi:MFS family permease